MRIHILFLFLFSSFLGASQNEWIPFDSPEGNFSLLVPDTMVHTTKELELAIGTLQYQIFHYQGLDTSENWLYQLSYVDYPEGSVHSDSTEFLEILFDENVKSSAKSVFGKVTYQQPDKYGKYPGHIFKVHFAEDKVAIKTRLYMVENRYYAISVTGPRGYSLNPKVEEFLNSFRLLELPVENTSKKRKKSG